MKKIIIPLLLISLIFTGCAKKSEKPVDNKGEAVETIQEKEKEEMISVKVEEVKSIDFQENLTLSGSLKVKDSVIVTSKVNGSIDNILVDIGSKVNKGDKLCKIDDTVYKIQHEKANIEVKRASNELSRLKDLDNGLKDQTIEAAENQYKTAKISYENAKKEYERMKNLYKEKAISNSQLEKAEQGFITAESSYISAKSNFEHAKRNYKYKLKSQEIQKASCIANYKLAKENLDSTDVTAPIAGIVADKSISLGESVGQGSKLYTIVNSDEMYIETGVSERDVINVKAGQKAFVKVGTLKESIEGKIIGVSPILDEQSKTYKVKVSVNNVDDKLKGGMFATVELIVGDNRKGLAVPKTSVLNKGGESFVYVLDKDRVQKRKVVIGYSNDKYYEIVEGIKKGDKVVTSFNDRIKDGSLVKIK